MDRVLLGAIFRKLPLKLLLVILACVAVFVACTKAELYTVLVDNQNFTYSRNEAIFNFDSDKINCFSFESITNSTINVYDGNNNFVKAITTNNGYANWEWYCSVGDFQLRFYSNGSTYTFWYQKYAYNTIGLIQESDCHVMTSNECQSEYNLIPINEVDNAYCESNNLCSSSCSPSDCPNVGVSNLFINDIFHPGAFNVIMNIPEEIDWDYAYTNSGSNINIDVVGYNQDTEYIESLVDINSYKPTSEDFTNVFSLFGEYGGLLVACLFVILVFYLIKKSFK